MDYGDIVDALGRDEFFGVLAGASTTEIVVYARNLDTSIGDLFLIPSDRGRRAGLPVPHDAVRQRAAPRGRHGPDGQEPAGHGRPLLCG